MARTIIKCNYMKSDYFVNAVNYGFADRRETVTLTVVDEPGKYELGKLYKVTLEEVASE